MAHVDYLSEVGLAFKRLWHTPILILPPILAVLAILPVLFFLIIINALIFIPVIGLKNFGSTANFLQGIVLAIAIPLSLLDILAIVLLFSWFYAGTLGMCSEASKGKNATFRQFLQYANKNWLRLFRFFLLSFLIILPLLAMLFTSIIPLFTNPGPTSILVFFIVLALFIPLTLIYNAHIYFGPFILIRSKLPAWTCIVRSFKLLWKKPKHTLISWLISIAVSIVITFAFIALMFPIRLLLELSNSLIITLSVEFGLDIIQQIIGTIVLLFTWIFGFAMYKTIEKEKV